MMVAVAIDKSAPVALDDVTKTMQESILPAVVECFCSRQDRLFVAAGRCLSLLRGRFSDRPEVMGEHGPKIAKTVLKTFEIVAGAPQLSQYLQSKAKARGLSGIGAAATLATGTRLLSALLNSADSVQWFNRLGTEEVALPALMKGGETKPPPVEPIREKGKKRKAAEEMADAVAKLNFFDALITHIRTALDTAVLQPSALQLLRRVLLRNRVLTAPVYQCIDAIGEVMVTAPDKRISQQCAQIYVDFMLDYPHEQRALQKRLQHLAGNLGYVEDAGRRAVLNCMYLVVLNFPQAQLASKWGGLLFVSAAARLPQESDATAHQMLHVLIKALLGRVGADTRQKLLELALPWAGSPKRILHAALAECLGLFAEVVEGVDGFVQLLRVALPVLAKLRLSAAAAEKDPTVQLQLQMGKGTQPWRVVYAVHRALERMITSAPESVWERIGSPLQIVEPKLLELPKAEGTSELVKQAEAQAQDAKKSKAQSTAEPEALSPGAALAYLWQDLLAGPKVFVDVTRHPWVVSVALRMLQRRLVACGEGPRTMAAWWFGGADAGDQAGGGFSTLTLMRALADLMGSERMEVEPALAKLGVTALKGYVKLLLRNVELMPAQIQEAEKAEEEDTEDPQASGGAAELGPHDEAGDLGVAADDDDDPGDAEKDIGSRVEGRLDKEAEADDSKMDCEASSAPIASETAEAPVMAEAASDKEGAIDGAKGDEDADGQKDEGDKRGEEAASDKEVEEPPDDEDEDVEDPTSVEDKHAAAGELEGDRHHGEQSLFEVAAVSAAAVSASGDDGGLEAAPACSSTAVVAAPITAEVAGDPMEVLRRSRTLWLAVRLSFKARSFLARPTQHVIRLVAVLRLFTGLAELLPSELLVHVLEPLISPAHRASSFFMKEYSTLPEVHSLDEVLHLRPRQQLEFVGQLAQTCLDTLSRRMQDAGMSSEFSKAVTNVRKAVEKKRTQRHMEKRLKPIRDPQAAAADKKAKNRRKQANKKRKMEEHIIATKGARGVTRAKKSRTLV
mmetsp:Transcript_47002/g.135426  ORF Transcript_47002/g.135426 Transcript_47002/m.135426 type:complete len:1019 (+) Transcript_47002:3-3059(+)